MKTLKFFYLFMMVFSMSVALTSCGDDDEEEFVNTYQDYFVEVQCADGGLDAQQISRLNAELTADMAELVDEGLTGVTQEQAVKLFDAVVYVFADTFEDGFEGVKGTLSISLTLKTTKGTVVRKATLKVTKDDCTVVK